MTHPYVSVIIPTYHEWHLLKRCLEALDRQSYPKERFEIIIVNNDPADQVPGYISFDGDMTVISEMKPGSYAARNTGLRQAKGEIIGFTDSDCVPHIDWIRLAVEYLSNNPDCSRIAGNISIIYKSKYPTIVEMYNQIYAFPQQWLVANGGGSITGNLFTYKRVFEEVGDFDEKLLSMGDVAWGKLAQRAGFKVHFVESVIVHHPSRDFKGLVTKERRHGGGAAYMSRKLSYVSGVLNLIYQLRPRINALRFILGKRKDLRLKDRIVIPLLRYYLLNIRAVEKFKVQMGKTPNRA